MRFHKKKSCTRNIGIETIANSLKQSYMRIDCGSKERCENVDAHLDRLQQLLRFLFVL